MGVKLGVLPEENTGWGYARKGCWCEYVSPKKQIKENDLEGACNTSGILKIYTNFSRKTWKGGKNLRELGVDGRTVL